MKRTDFDVVVVGAGVGGATSAYILGQAGFRVLVVERARLPRHKACGGAIPRRTLDRFPFSFGEVIRAEPDRVRLTFPGLAAVDEPLPERPVVMVRRSEFDAFLLARADAEVLTGQPVSGVTETAGAVQVQIGQQQLSARYAVAADGANSTVARCLGLRRDRQLGGTLEAEIPLNGSRSLRARYGSRAVFSLGVVPWGYAWIFPKAERLSVGISHFRQGHVDLRSALRHEMERLGISLNGAELHGHPLPSYQARPWPLWRGQPQERLSSGRCVLVGDAAGLVDPLIGEGIRYAMASARLASQAIIDDDLSGYEAAIWREMGHSLATAGLTANLYYRWPKLCVQLGLRNPATIRHFVDIFTERSSYEGIGRRLIATAARWQLGGRRAVESMTDPRLITEQVGSNTEEL
jgi:geranylgeranyl reductase family protein